MRFISPLGLLWLLSIPVLIWLWRFNASRHQIKVASLIPFAHLLRRSPKKKYIPVFNSLFWLQLCALFLIAAAIAGLSTLSRSNKTVMVLWDTSASMKAYSGGESPFKKSREFLLDAISRESKKNRFFIIKTATTQALSRESISDAGSLHRMVESTQASSMSQDLASANRIGQALLGKRPERIMILTDEEEPNIKDDSVEFHSFGRALGNVAIVGFDAYEPLCIQTPANVVVTVQNFSEFAQEVRLSVLCGAKLAAVSDSKLLAGERSSVSLKLEEGLSGACQVRLDGAKQDALSIDNSVIFSLKGQGGSRAELVSENTVLTDILGRWLDACPRISWKKSNSAESWAASFGPEIKKEIASSDMPILITDEESFASRWPFTALLVSKSQKDSSVHRVQWLVDSSHPLGEYLQPLETVYSGPLSYSAGQISTEASQNLSGWGDPVVWGLVDGNRLPIVYASSVDGKRKVRMLIDPLQDPNSTPMIILILNSLRWLSGSSAILTTGEPLIVGPFKKGVVRIRRPDTRTDSIYHDGGLLKYELTDEAGIYRFSQADVSVERTVNFLNPTESNTLKGMSTWQYADPVKFGPPRFSDPVLFNALAGWLAGALILILILEWILYSNRRR